jgi:hypothetical protein
MRTLAFALTAIALLGAPAMAAQPADPGGFGKDRAAYIHDVAQADPSSPGASEVGQILSGRAGDNGTINNQYKVDHGDVPAGVTPGTGNN